MPTTNSTLLPARNSVDTMHRRAKYVCIFATIRLPRGPSNHHPSLPVRLYSPPKTALSLNPLQQTTTSDKHTNTATHPHSAHRTSSPRSSLPLSHPCFRSAFRDTSPRPPLSSFQLHSVLVWNKRSQEETHYPMQLHQPLRLSRSSQFHRFSRPPPRDRLFILAYIPRSPW